MYFSKAESTIAKQCVKEIAEQFLNQPISGHEFNPSLLSGSAGELLFCYNYAQHFGGFPDHKLKVYEEKLIDRLLAPCVDTSLANGYPGILWALQQCHIQLDPEVIDFYQRLTTHRLQSENWVGRYELISGLCGIHFHLVNNPSKKARKNLRLLVDQIDQTSRQLKSGRVWLTPKSKVPSQQPAATGMYNMGLSHGIPAIWATLAHIYRQDLEKSLTKKIFNESFNWFKNVLEHHPECIPANLLNKKEMPNSRLAWSYGDPGLAIALLQASHVFDHSEAFGVAKDLLMRTTTRESPHIADDAAICHGAAGLALIYKTAFEICKDDRFEACAQKWFSKILEFRVDTSKGVFKSFHDFDYKTKKTIWAHDSSFITGNAGIGLALMTALENSSHEWSRCLLIR